MGVKPGGNAVMQLTSFAIDDRGTAIYCMWYAALR
jgi:hypothetical protein